MCDCLPADGTIFDTPAEITGVQVLGDKTTLQWNSDAANSGTGTLYDVMRGELAELPVGGGAGETCLEDDSTDTQSSDPATPAAGTGRYYLVRGDNPCGAGSWGSDSGGVERVSAACP